MDLTLEQIHHRILALEHIRRTLYSGRSRDIAALSLNHSEGELENIDTFAGAVARIEGELYQLWSLKRLLLIDRESLVLRKHPELRNWSWLSPMISVSEPRLRASPTPVLGMDF